MRTSSFILILFLIVGHHCKSTLLLTLPATNRLTCGGAISTPDARFFFGFRWGVVPEY
jgi:hypothetical protein